MRNPKLVMVGIAGVAMLAKPLDAQTVAAATEPEAGLTDIIITATRAGETNLQKTPLAVTAFGAEALAARGITSALDLNAMAPNVSIGSRSGSGGSQGAITIRGIGIDASQPAAPAVGIYVDDVYIPAQYGNLLGVFDLQQIEILRGPQGTLFGRNTIGGALLYNSVRPGLEKIGGFAEATFGNQQHRDFFAGINIPIVKDVVALRVSGADTSRDGYVLDLLNNVYRGSEKNAEVRVQLRIKPTDNLLIDLKAEQVLQRSNGPAATQIGFNNNAVFNVIGSLPGPPFPLSPTYISPGYYTDYGNNAPDSFRGKIKIAQGVVTYDVLPNLKLKSITAYSENVDLLILDNDGTPRAVSYNSRGTNVNKLFTQEFQLAGNFFGDHLHYTLGAYYYDEDSTNTGSFNQIAALPPSLTFGNYEIKRRSYAGYGQVTYDITNRLSVVGGLRYSSEKASVTNSLAVTPAAIANYAANSPVTFHNTSPLVGVNFQATDDILVYAKWSRGFRAGGFSPNVAGAYYYGPETADTYELGSRIELFDHRLRLNPTIFQTDWNNIQFNSVQIIAGQPFPIISNAGNARIKGFEVESQAQITRDFSINASGALLDGHYTSVLTPAVTLASTLKRAPKASFTVGGHYDIDVGEGKIDLSTNYAWQAHQRSASSDIDNVEIAAYGLLSARVEYRTPENRYRVALFANNLNNIKYAIGGVNFGASGAIPTVERDVGRPREFGIDLKFAYK